MSDIEKIKKLRKSTGAGFKDCNTALNESKGNIDKAAEILRIKGISKASKKMSRLAKEGVVAVVGTELKKSLIEINCETDFVAKNEDFIEFAKEISEMNNLVNSDLDKLKNLKMKNTKTVTDNLVALISKIGEKITIGKAKTFNSKDSINFSYLHTVVKDNLSKLAVIVSLETKNDTENIKTFGKHLCMHVAASNPLSIESSDINKEVIDKEIALISEELKNTGKSDEIVKNSNNETDINWITKYSPSQQEFKTYIWDLDAVDVDGNLNDNIGFDIEGGQGYIVNVSSNRHIEFVGSPWTGELNSAPTTQDFGQSKLWAFILTGRVDDLNPGYSNGHKITINNLTSQKQFLSKYRVEGNFRIPIIDSKRESFKPSITIGETI